ncbi:hypothetical protein L7F22_012581, partial [Adiantum nelumboides]|nr:hypothetical protein [Adiantum nelumboides]
GVYGVEPGTGAAYGGDKYGVAGHDGHHATLGEHLHGDQAAGYGAPASAAAHHEGPMQKVKNKVKGKKEGHDDSSSSSSSESDGEGGRRKKKLGIF